MISKGPKHSYQPLLLIYGKHQCRIKSLYHSSQLCLLRQSWPKKAVESRIMTKIGLYHLFQIGLIWQGKRYMERGTIQHNRQRWRRIRPMISISKQKLNQSSLIKSSIRHNRIRRTMIVVVVQEIIIAAATSSHIKNGLALDKKTLAKIKFQSR